MKPRAHAGIFCIAILLCAFCAAQTKPTWIQSGDDAAIRALIEKMAAARNAHDGDAAAATYTNDGEYIGSSRTFRGRIELAQLWGSMKGQMQRTIQAVDFIAPSIAVVHVLSDYPKPATLGREVFVLVKENAGWKIRVGATVPWDDGRWNIPLSSSSVN